MHTVRVLPPGVLPPGGSSFTAVCGDGVAYPSAGPETPGLAVPGRTYIAAPGQVLDVVEMDAMHLQAQGWVPVTFGLPALKQGGSGPTSGRPANPLVGCHYYDTTVGDLAVWDGGAWRSAGTGNSI